MAASIPEEINFKEIPLDFSAFEEIPITDLDLKVKETSLGILDNLVLGFYKFQFGIATSRYKTSPEIVDEVFTGAKNIIYVHNFAKKEELKKYIDSSLKVDEFEARAQEFGLYPEKNEAKIKPIGKGKCFGAVAYFFMRIPFLGIKAAAEEFKEGIPHEAARFHTAYDTFCRSISNEPMENLIRKIIDSYPKAANKERFWQTAEKLWKQQFNHPELIPVFESLKEFLSEGKDSIKENLLEAIKEKMEKRKFIFGGRCYASVRNIAKDYLKKNLTALDMARFGYSLAGLKLDVIHHDVDAAVVLKSIKDLGPGKYYIDISIPNKVTKHALGIIIEPDGTSYVFDPNLAIAELDTADVQKTVERDFKGYGISVEGSPEMSKTGFSIFKVTS